MPREAVKRAEHRGAVVGGGKGEIDVAVKRSETSSATEDYLKAIYSLAEENDQVIAARVAEDIGVTPSTMFSALRRLEKEEFVRVERRKNIYLTPKGREVAEAILRRHFLTERLLTDLLGLDWVTAHQEAHHLEHAISPVVEERLAAILDNPATCPHGNPIPVKERAVRRAGSGYPWIRRRRTPRSSFAVSPRVASAMRDCCRSSTTTRVRPGTTINILDVAPSPRHHHPSASAIPRSSWVSKPPRRSTCSDPSRARQATYTSEATATPAATTDHPGTCAGARSGRPARSVRRWR